MKTAINRAIEAIEAAELTVADEMGATLDLSTAARMALIAKVAAAIQTAVAEEQQTLELTDEEVLTFLNLLNHAIENGWLPPSPHIRKLRAIGAKLQTTFFRSPTADAEIG